MQPLALDHVDTLRPLTGPHTGNVRTRNRFFSAAAWLTSAGLVTVGVLGLNTDGELMLFDGACIIVGLAAAPPITDMLRSFMPRELRPSLHALAAMALVIGGGALDFARASITPAPFPVESHGSFTSFAAIRPAADVEQNATDAARKVDYLQQVSDQLGAIANERALSAEDVGAADAHVIQARQALIAQRRNFTLTAEESAAVDRFAAQVASQKRAALPALRADFITDLNGALAGYGLSARFVDDVLEFDGAALSDPAKQTLMVSMTKSQRAFLGYKETRFVMSDSISNPNASLAKTAQADSVQPGA